MQSTAGTSNNYPEGQCTRYADQRYHDLTGYYVPWNGNAQDWSSQAPLYGWKVSSSPVAPSIICLQGGTQGADVGTGHVGVVESVNGKTVNVSNLNWGSTPSQVTNVTFYVGPGVTFLYAVDNGGKALGSSGSSLLSTLTDYVTGNGGGKVPIKLAPTADVTTLLWTIDQTMDVTNPFANINATQDTFPGVSFTDPVSWIEQFGGNLIDDLSASLVRMIFLIIGTVILLKVLSAFIDFQQLAQTVQGGAMLLA